MADELFSVASLEEGRAGVVGLLSGEDCFTHRLAGMDIVPGTKIKVLRKSGRLIIVFAAETRVAPDRFFLREVFLHLIPILKQQVITHRGSAFLARDHGGRLGPPRPGTRGADYV